LPARCPDRTASEILCSSFPAKKGLLNGILYGITSTAAVEVIESFYKI
jgi:hypothetical protein